MSLKIFYEWYLWLTINIISQYCDELLKSLGPNSIYHTKIQKRQAKEVFLVKDETSL